MMAETFFKIANGVAVVGWLGLLFFPRTAIVRDKIARLGIPLFFSAAYLSLLISQLGSLDGNFNSLAGVTALFSNPFALLGGWVHYLAFDLFVGSWELQDSQRRGIPHWRVVPCLIVTFMAGPIGFGLYIVLRTVSASVR